MVNAKSVTMSAVLTGAGGSSCTSSSAPAMVARAAAIHCRRSPTWSTSGDQQTLALHRRPAIETKVDPLGAIEVVELLCREQVEHPPRSRGDVGLEVRDPALAGTDRDVEAEAVALEPGAAGLERVHAAPVEEDRAVHVAAIGEVPERAVGHAATSADTPRWRRYTSITHRYAG